MQYIIFPKWIFLEKNFFFMEQLMAPVSHGIHVGNWCFETTCLLCFSGEKRRAEESWPDIQWKVAENTLSFSPILNYHHLRLWDYLQESSPILLSNSFQFTLDSKNSINYSFYCANEQRINSRRNGILYFWEFESQHLRSCFKTLDGGAPGWLHG